MTIQSCLDCRAEMSVLRLGHPKRCHDCKRARWRAGAQKRRDKLQLTISECPATIERAYQRALAQIKAERRFTVEIARRSPLADVR